MCTQLGSRFGGRVTGELGGQGVRIVVRAFPLLKGVPVGRGISGDRRSGGQKNNTLATSTRNINHNELTQNGNHEKNRLGCTLYLNTDGCVGRS